MSPTAYVIDTSYLYELFNLDNKPGNPSVMEVRSRFQKATAPGITLFVPIPCLFELGNHIADIADGNRRHVLATSLMEAIRQSVKEGDPWTVIPEVTLEVVDIPELWQAFANRYIQTGMGLTDSFTVQEALRLKAKYNFPEYKVHIWTKDKSLKAHEPDTEPNPYIK